MNITGCDNIIRIEIKYRIFGNGCYLSHSETMKVFERALVRAGVKMVYSRGFNPRPKLSLPLPRPVGVETDEDLLYIEMDLSSEVFDGTVFCREIAKQLPDGIEPVSARQVLGRAGVPSGAAYYFPLRREILCDERRIKELQSNAEELLSRENIPVRRRLFGGKSRFRDTEIREKEIDARRFLEDIKPAEDGIIVRCKVSSEGGIRIEEVMNLLEVDMADIEGPIRRTEVKWL